MKKSLAFLTALIAIGCGSDPETFLVGQNSPPPQSNPPTLQSLSLGRQGSMLLRLRVQQVLFPELNLTTSAQPESLTVVVEMTGAAGDAELVRPPAQPGVSSDLSSDGTRLSLTFTGLSASQIQNYLRSQLKGINPILSYSPSGITFRLTAQVGSAGQTVESQEFFLAGPQALSLVVSTNGRVVNADTQAEVRSTGSLQAAVDAVAAISTDSLGGGSLIRLEPGTHNVGSSGVLIPRDFPGDTGHLRIWGANFDRAGDPTVASPELAGRARQQETILRRSWPTDGSAASLIIDQADSGGELRGLTLEIQTPAAAEGSRTGFAALSYDLIAGNVFVSTGPNPIDRVTAVQTTTDTSVRDNRFDRVGVGVFQLTGTVRHNAFRQVNVAMLTGATPTTEALTFRNNAVALSSSPLTAVLAIVGTQASVPGSIVFANNDLVGFLSLSNLFAYTGVAQPSGLINQAQNFLNSPTAGVPAGSTQTITGGVDAFLPSFLNSTTMGRATPNFPAFVP